MIRQALRADLVDELAISVAPVVLGGGKRLFDGFDRDLDLRIIQVYPVHVRRPHEVRDPALTGLVADD